MLRGRASSSFVRWVILSAILVAVVFAAIAIPGYPNDPSESLALLWVLISARGLWKALMLLKRAKSEFRGARTVADPELKMIASGNVRRNMILFAKLTIFLIIGIGAVFNANTATFARAGIVLILLLMSGGAELDADEIDRFDELARHQHAIQQPTNLREVTGDDR